MALSNSEVVEEMKSWRRFADALRKDDRETFMEMIGLCHEYIPAMQARASPNPSEPFFMALLFVQHKAIRRLVREVERLKAERDAGLDS